MRLVVQPLVGAALLPIDAVGSPGVTWLVGSWELNGSRVEWVKSTPCCCSHPVLARGLGDTSEWFWWSPGLTLLPLRLLLALGAGRLPRHVLTMPARSTHRFPAVRSHACVG
jgi:hypothetical protein